MLADPRSRSWSLRSSGVEHLHVYPRDYVFHYSFSGGKVLGEFMAETQTLGREVVREVFPEDGVIK